VLDALNAWQLVREAKEALGLPAAASFKHCSPAGAALGLPLTRLEARAYAADLGEARAPSLAAAYVRARQADPLSSFGDFVGLSDVVDEATASALKREVSDGVVAPGFEPAALAVLRAKKGGRFVCLEVDAAYEPPEALEYREVFGVGLAQRRNDRKIGLADVRTAVTTARTAIPEDKQRDLVLAAVACKYAQSNSVALAVGGQVVGVGAGQQSRVHCVEVAAKKVLDWHLRFHPDVLGLDLPPGASRQAKVNARAAYLDDHRQRLADDPAHGAAALKGLCLASDAFFPFPDSIDVARQVGVEFVAQTGGSLQDDAVIRACDDHHVAMAFTGIRLFHH